MKVNLANVYAFLLDKYGEHFTVTYASKPSYLQSIIELREEKIVFINLEERLNTNVSSPVSPSRLVIGKNTSDLDLTGSPLKDDCVIDIVDMSMNLISSTSTPRKLVEECHRGIDAAKARSIFCSEAFQKQLRSNETSGSVWILCNGVDPEKTMFLQYEFLTGYDSRGIVSFMGFTTASALTSAQPLLKRHYTSIRPGNSIDTQVENIYEEKAGIKIRCSWSTSSAMPALIDLSNCDVTLSQTFRLSDSGPLTKDLLNQLRILTYIRQEIISYKGDEANSSTKEPSYECGCGIEKDDLNDGINKIMTDVSGLVDNEVGVEIENDIEAVVQKANFRRLTDLTDKLWDVLNRCSSYKELKTAFQVIFQCAARCNIVNIPTNKNRLAEIITEVSNRRLAIPYLTGTEPLELLLEIGLEKLNKDYEFIFTQSKICGLNNFRKTTTLDQNTSENVDPLSGVRKSLRNAIVKPETAKARKTLLHSVNSGMRKPLEDFIGFKNSYFDENTTAMEISKLIQIHCALEHLLMIQINLQLQNVYTHICEQLLSRSLDSYNTIMDESFADKMDISIPAYDIRECLEGKQPHSRCIVLKSESKFRMSKTTFYYNIENIFPPGLSKCIENSGSEITQETVYYGWIYQKVQTLK